MDQWLNALRSMASPLARCVRLLRRSAAEPTGSPAPGALTVETTAAGPPTGAHETEDDPAPGGAHPARPVQRAHPSNGDGLPHAPDPAGTHEREGAARPGARPRTGAHPGGPAAPVAAQQAHGARHVARTHTQRLRAAGSLWMLPADGSTRSGREPADAVVEFVLLAPVLLMLLLGVFELGRVVDAWVIVHNAAREGARAGAVAPADAATVAGQAAATYLNSNLTSRDIPLGSIEATGLDVPNSDVTVTAMVQVEVYTPFMRAIAARNSVTLPVRATATMRRQ